MANVRVIEAELGGLTSRTYGPMRRAKGISGRAERRIAVATREALRTALQNLITRVYLDGSAPRSRSGKARRIMSGGVRAFGTRLEGIRGHIIGPDYIRAQEEGARITPKSARALAIPLPPAQRPDGTPKLPGPRSWQNIRKTFLWKSKRTNQMYIVYQAPDGESLVFLYALVDEVELGKYKDFLRNGWLKERDIVFEAFGQAMLFEMSRVNLGRLARVTTGGRRRRR